MKLIILAKLILYYIKLNSLVGGSIYSLTQSKKIQILVEKKTKENGVDIKRVKTSKMCRKEHASWRGLKIRKAFPEPLNFST